MDAEEGAMAALVITVNGVRREVAAPAETPLLSVLRDELGLNGPRYGCGLEQCGACMVLRGAEAVASCRLPVGQVADAQITTLEGLGTPDEPHPVQQAFLEEQAAQCGYCSNGMLIAAAALIWRTPHPTDEQIRAALDDVLCRCGSHLRIIRAVKRAAALMWEEQA
jgi:nicotinate dehydrogenase subunit A